MDAYDRAVRLLATRSHFRRELGQKLTARGYAQEEVEAALDRLAREGYLDDRQTAAEFVAGRLARGAEGRRRLAGELVRRGADPEAVEAALADLPDDDLELARQAAAQWAARGGRNPAASAAALARHLDRKGFSRRAIVGVLKDWGGEAGNFED